MDAGYCLHVYIFIHILSHLNRLILTILINSCQTSGFSKVGMIIKYNIMQFPVLIKTVLKLVYMVSAITSPDWTGAKVYYQSGPGLVPVRPHNIGSPSAANVHASH